MSDSCRFQPQVSEAEKKLEGEKGASEAARAEAAALKSDLGAARDSLAAASQQLASEREASAHFFCCVAVPLYLPAPCAAGAAGLGARRR